MTNRCGRESSTNFNAGGAEQHEERWRVFGNEAQMYDACEFPAHDYEDVMAAKQERENEQVAQDERAAYPAHPEKPDDF